MPDLPTLLADLRRLDARRKTRGTINVAYDLAPKLPAIIAALEELAAINHAKDRTHATPPQVP